MKRHYLIDHRALFLFGYLFYLFIPYYVGVHKLFQGFPGMDMFHGFFALVPASKLAAYFLITLTWIPAFYLGHLSFKVIVLRRRPLAKFPSTPLTRTVPYIALLLIGVLVIFTFLARGSLFGGYASYDIAARGKMSTLLVIFNFFFLYQSVTRQQPSWLLTGGMIMTALLLLSMGGRMYAIQTFLIFLVYKTSFADKRWKGRHLLIASLAGFFLASFIGLWRIHTSFAPTAAIYSLLAEPVFTWFSTSTYLAANDIPVINMPLNFLTSFLNMVPNTFFSLKPYLVSTLSMAKYQSPLGADSVWTSLVINFGSVGSFLFIFVTGFILHLLRHLSERSRFWAVYYILVCGLLPFQLFRDGFYLIHKQLYFNFLFLPALILVVLKTIMLVQSSRMEQPYKLPQY